jgi:tRNA-dihydrouridine synthase 3
MQLAGSKPQLMVPAAEIISQVCAGNLDFVDINCGCPIDLVYKTGSGSACGFPAHGFIFFFDRHKILVLDAANKLGKIIVGMNKVLGDVPVTVKLRTGVKDGKNTAHKLMPRLNAEWGAAALTVSIHVLFSILHLLYFNAVAWAYATTALFKVS